MSETSRQAICHIDEIGEAGRGFTLTGVYDHRPEKEVPLFVIRDGDNVRCFSNICPHQGVPLEFKPDTFLDVERAFIQCSTHGAKFRKDDGFCVNGPCVGRSLKAWPVRVGADGMVLFGD